MAADIPTTDPVGGPGDAIAWARAGEADEMLLCAVMLSRLCGDPTARSAPMHRVLHRGFGVAEHVGPAFVEATRRSLGISASRAAWLVESLDREAALAGLGATEG